MNKDNAINYFRGFLAVTIIWHHLQPMYVLDKDIFFLISFPGRITVWLFFILSGYSIYFGYAKKKYHFNLRDIFRFYFNRAIRILPLFYFTAIITWLCYLYISPQDLPHYSTIVRTLFFFDLNLNRGLYEFTPTWFIAVIINFYLLAPILINGYQAVVKKFGLLWTLAVLLMSSIFFHWIGKEVSGSYDIRNIIGIFPLFAFGFWSYDFYHSHWLKTKYVNKWISSSYGFLIIIIVLEFCFWLYNHHPGIFFVFPLELLIGLLGVMMIVRLLTINNSKVKKKKYRYGIIEKSLQILGQQSFGLYLWHVIPMLILLKTGLFWPGPPPYETVPELFIAFALVFITSLLISILFYYILEIPYRKMYRNPNAKIVV
jgi:peptidoglycan/LPS O-acetylase OafA/YrhL